MTGNSNSRVDYPWKVGLLRRFTHENTNSLEECEKESQKMVSIALLLMEGWIGARNEETY